MKVIFPGQLRKNDGLFMSAAEGDLPFVNVYAQSAAEIVYGPSCRRAGDEILVDRCADDGVMISERRGGGGTVVLSPGALVIVVVGNKKHPREGAVDIFRRVHDGIIDVLRKIGVDAVHAGISDIAVNGKKILGSSLYMGSKPPLFYYQSSLMVSNDIELMSRYLRHPPREPTYRQGRCHRDFCATLEELGASVDMGELSVQIESTLTERLA